MSEYDEDYYYDTEFPDDWHESEDNEFDEDDDEDWEDE